MPAASRDSGHAAHSPATIHQRPATECHNPIASGPDPRRRSGIPVSDPADRLPFKATALGRAYDGIVRLPVVFLLEDVRSLYNVGAFFRTADAAGLESLLLVGITAPPPDRRIAKTALGAEERVRWERWPETEAAIEAYRARGFDIAALDTVAPAIDLFDWRPRSRSASSSAMRSRASGRGPWNSRTRGCEFRCWGLKHSLNVATAAGVVAYELLRRFRSVRTAPASPEGSGERGGRWYLPSTASVRRHDDATDRFFCAGEDNRVDPVATHGGRPGAHHSHRRAVHRREPRHDFSRPGARVVGAAPRGARAQPHSLRTRSCTDTGRSKGEPACWRRSHESSRARTASGLARQSRLRHRRRQHGVHERRPRDLRYRRRGDAADAVLLQSRDGRCHGGRTAGRRADRCAVQLDLGAVAAAVTPRTRAIVTMSPNNPTGAVYPRTTCAP